jgi:hypothetical protein
MEILRTVSAILAMAGRVRRRRITRITVVCGIVSVAGVMGCTGEVPPGYNASEHRRVEQVHAQFAPALERYRQAHGEYPPTLQAAGIETPETMYGPLRYRTWRSSDGISMYEVSFGDYDRNGFVASLNSMGQEWSLDT